MLEHGLRDAKQATSRLSYDTALTVALVGGRMPTAIVARIV